MKIIALTVIVCVMAIVNIASAGTFGMGANQFLIDFLTISGGTSSANGTNICQYSSGDSRYETFNEPGGYTV